MLDWRGSDIGGHISQVKRLLSEDLDTDTFEILDYCNRTMYIRRAEGEEGFIWDQLSEDEL